MDIGKDLHLRQADVSGFLMPHLFHAGLFTLPEIILDWARAGGAEKW
jgi:hypothetical protein